MAGSTLINIIKEASKLPDSETTDLLLGTVTSINPLKVKVDNRYELDSDFLILSTLVRDFNVDMTVNHVTEDKSGGSGQASFASHNHAYQGRKTFTVHLGLTVGEKVLLLRVQNGQKFIIIDRVRQA